MKSILWQTKAYENVFQIDRSPELEFRWHHHNYWEVFGVVAGDGQVLVGDYHHRFQPGEIYVLPPKLPHAFFALSDVEPRQDSGDFFVFVIDLEALASLVNTQQFQQWEKTARGGLCYRDAFAKEIFALLTTVYQQNQLSQTITALQLIERLMAAPHTPPLTGFMLPDSLSQHDIDRIEQVLDHLHTHYAERILLPDLAAANGMSEKSLSRIFKKSMGQTVIEYLHRLRISMACQRLSASDQPITQIAFECGFGSLSSFNRTFNRYQEMTPSDYRRVNAS